MPSELHLLIGLFDVHPFLLLPLSMGASADVQNAAGVDTFSERLLEQLVYDMCCALTSDHQHPHLVGNITFRNCFVILVVLNCAEEFVHRW